MARHDLTGSRIGDVEIIADIGSDAIFENLQGHDLEHDCDRLLVLAGRQLEPDPVVTAQFRTDLRTVSRLKHPCFPAITDFGAIENGTYIIYDWVDALPLTDHIAHLPDGLGLDEVLFIARQIASALDYAHQNGVVHGFLTPANILVTRSLAVTVMRFGFSPFLARLLAESLPLPSDLEPYLAPEMIASPLAISPAADTIAFARLVHWLFCGEQVQGFAPSSALSDKVPEPAISLLNRALAENPADRPDSVMAFLVGFEWACLHPGVIPPDPRTIRRPPSVGFDQPLPPPRALTGSQAKRDIRRLRAEAKQVARRQAQADRVAERERRRIAKDLKQKQQKLREELINKRGYFELEARQALGEELPEYLTIDDPGSKRFPWWGWGLIALGSIGLAAALLIPSSPIALAGRQAPVPEESTPLTPTGTAVVADVDLPQQTPEPTADPATPVIPTPTPYPGVLAAAAGQVAYRYTDGARMVYIPAGAFLMGTDDPARLASVRPRHEVTLSAYWIDQTEVTNGAYALCVEAGACREPINPIRFANPAFTSYPVYTVTYDDASGYCAWLAQLTGEDIALPTEAQWEKAATWDEEAGSPRLYPWGDADPAPGLLAYAGGNLGEPAPVGSYPEGASYYGVLDLSGNLWEWMFDVYDAEAYTAPGPFVDPTGPQSGVYRSTRGGSWSTEGYLTIPTARNPVRPEQYSTEIGFRCALSGTDLPEEGGFYSDPLHMVDVLIADLASRDGAPLAAELGALREVIARGEISTAAQAADALLLRLSQGDVEGEGAALYRIWSVLVTLGSALEA